MQSFTCAIMTYHVQVVNCSFTFCICRLAACQTKQKKHNRKSQTNMAPLWKIHELNANNILWVHVSFNYI